MALSDGAIIAMARDANPEHDLTAMLPFLSRFAALVAEKAAAKEREACAVLLENRAGNLFAECPPSDRENFAAACEADWCADLVRAMGKP